MNTNPIRQIEEAIILLRRLDLSAWSAYLLAAVPLLLTLLWFVRDMSNALQVDRCAFDSLLCALAFLWAGAWKAKFGASLLATRNGSGLASPQSGFWRALYLQSVLQTLKLIVWPFAIISVFPIAWTAIFFRNATIEAGLGSGTLRSTIVKSARRSNVNVSGNWIGVLILTVIWLLAFLNVYLLVGLLPFLFRMFSGVESSFTRDIGMLFGFNVFCIVLAMTWLIIDPLVLAYAVVRCFYSEARTDGRDLLAQLRPAAATLLLFLAVAPIPPIHADTLSNEKLSHALQQAAQSDDYNWLRIHRQPAATEDTFFTRMNREIQNAFRTLRSWISDAGHWVRRLFEKSTPGSPDESGRSLAAGDVRWLLYGLAALAIVAAVLVIWRSSDKAVDSKIASSAAAPPPDLNHENVLATDLPEDEWLRLARELSAKGDLRLAVRAMYLSNLSYLGSERLLQIARSKSNAIYEGELRRAPRGGQVSAPFSSSNRSFERIWYGFHEVTHEVVETFQRDVEDIRRHAKA